jgi:hypothetical protein
LRTRNGAIWRDALAGMTAMRKNGVSLLVIGSFVTSLPELAEVVRHRV